MRLYIISIQLGTFKYMKGPKRTQVERVGSVDIKKTVSVTKCFICNQMFYSQKTFDDHMKLHSSKLSRDVPEEIQRRTMESFRLKKNQPSTPSQPITVNGKKMLNQTTGALRTTIDTKEKDEDKEDQMERQQIKQAEEALRSSTILIEKIEALMQQQPQRKQQNQQQVDRQQSEQMREALTEQQFLILALTAPKVTCQQAESTKFTISYLQSCQDQLIYLSKMLAQLKRDEVNHKKYEGMRLTILAAMVEYAKQNCTIRPQKDGGVYLTNVKTKEQESEQEEGMEIVENEVLAYCNGCYMRIQYGEDCYKEKQGNGRYYHVQCWEDRHPKAQ